MLAENCTVVIFGKDWRLRCMTNIWVGDMFLGVIFHDKSKDDVCLAVW
jgi:hypothetical protein